ncbi:MAG: transglycosylase SLT domain-containing protein [Bdellovibrionaceae bacterium]|nr:transglycosylase SLT domain-containing protein [Pseudobdellovibrionaceae bacterium]
MFYQVLGAAAFAAIIWGCASTSRMDTKISPSSQTPAYDFIVANRDHGTNELNLLVTNSDNQSWWKKYRQGLLTLEKDASASCGYFTELSKEDSFPLKDLALLRAHQTCVDDKTLAPLKPELYRNNYKYAQDILATVVLKDARKSEDKADDIDALREIAKLESIPKKKEQYLLEAVKLAEDLKDQTKLEDVKAQLYRTSPRLRPHPVDKEILAAAMNFRERREFEEALKIYRQIAKDPKASNEEKYQALKNIRMTYKISQDKNSYIDATSQMVNFSKASFKKNKRDQNAVKHLHESYILLARTLWTEDQLNLAQKNLAEAQRLLKGLHPLDEVYFVLGRMAEEKNDLDKASYYYEASLKEVLSSQSIRDRVLWLYPWVLYKMKNFDKAAQSMAEYYHKAKENSDRTRSLFWQARALKSLNKNDEAKNLLEKLIKEDPIGYYGVLAVRELGQTYPPLASNEKDFSYSLFNLKEVGSVNALQAEWLMAVGENSFSEKVIDQISDELKRRGKGDEKSWLIVMTSYARANLYLPLFASFSGLPQDVKDTMVQKHPELLFPRNYKEQIVQSTTAEKIPAEIAFSIIRQESAFNPRARSPVDAFGLMQLLPSVAKELSRNTSVPYREAEDLYDPEINVPLGAKEIRGLLRKYDDQYILGVAAYNASGSAIRGWLKTRYRPDALEFIEEIPYDETRAYVKLVMRNFVFYKRLQASGPVSFPEEWLKLVSK